MDDVGENQPIQENPPMPQNSANFDHNYSLPQGIASNGGAIQQKLKVRNIDELRNPKHNIVSQVKANSVDLNLTLPSNGKSEVANNATQEAANSLGRAAKSTKTKENHSTAPPGREEIRLKMDNILANLNASLLKTKLKEQLIVSLPLVTGSGASDKPRNSLHVSTPTLKKYLDSLEKSNERLAPPCVSSVESNQAVSEQRSAQRTNPSSTPSMSNSSGFKVPNVPARSRPHSTPAKSAEKKTPQSQNVVNSRPIDVDQLEMLKELNSNSDISICAISPTKKNGPESTQSKGSSSTSGAGKFRFCLG